MFYFPSVFSLCPKAVPRNQNKFLMMNFCFQIQPERTKIKTRLDETIHCLSYFALLEGLSSVGYWAQSLKGTVQ